MWTPSSKNASLRLTNGPDGTSVAVVAEPAGRRLDRHARGQPVMRRQRLRDTTVDHDDLRPHSAEQERRDVVAIRGRRWRPLERLGGDGRHVRMAPLFVARRWETRPSGTARRRAHAGCRGRSRRTTDRGGTPRTRPDTSRFAPRAGSSGTDPRFNPAVALVLELERQLLAAGSDDASFAQHVHVVRARCSSADAGSG